MSWILLAVVAQCINAGVALVDKYIVTSEKVQARPSVYAFYTCILAGMWVMVFIFGIIPIPFLSAIGIPSLAHVTSPTLYVAVFSILSAYAFFIALVSLYAALKDADASDVIPVVGAVSAMVAFGLSHLFLNVRLTPNFVAGLLLLSFGTLMVSHLRFTWKIALSAIHAGIFFAVHYVTMKGLFAITSFDDGFFWSRVGFFIVALSMLMIPGFLKKIHTQTKKTTRHSGLLVLGAKLMGGIGSIMILKATAVGNVAIVQALGGLQFVFLLFFMLFLGHKTPPAYGEKVKHRHEIYHKIIFIILITVGFFVLFV